MYSLDVMMVSVVDVEVEEPQDLRSFHAIGMNKDNVISYYLFFTEFLLFHAETSVEVPSPCNLRQFPIRFVFPDRRHLDRCKYPTGHGLHDSLRGYMLYLR